MKPRSWRHALPAAGCVVFLLTIVLPTIALLARCVVDGEYPAGGFAVSQRQWSLLAKSAALAALGTLGALVVSIPGAYVVGRLGGAGGGPRRAALAALVLGPLLFPPMVYAFGWQKLLPAALSQQVQCVGVWALWAYPIPALLIGTGWSRWGRAAYDAALLNASPVRAFVRVVLPMLTPHVTVAATILFVIFLGEYSVPHACGVLVYSTELLGWSAASARVVDTLWLSLPPIALIVVAVIGGGWAWSRGVTDTVPEGGPSVRGTSVTLVVLAVVCFAVSPLVPLAALGASLGSLSVMEQALNTYGAELLQSLVVAGFGGLLTVAMGVGVASLWRVRRPALIWALAFGALPGALVGEAVLSAYQAVPLIYHHWPLIVLGYVARFGWVGVLAMALASRAAPQELAWQARTDGADEITVTLRISAAMSWPTLLFGACLAAAMSLAELPTSSMLRVPSLGLIAHILVEKFHRFEDGMLVSLSFWLVLSAVPAAVSLMVVLRRQRIRP